MSKPNPVTSPKSKATLSKAAKSAAAPKPKTRAQMSRDAIAKVQAQCVPPREQTSSESDVREAFAAFEKAVAQMRRALGLKPK